MDFLFVFSRLFILGNDINKGVQNKVEERAEELAALREICLVGGSPSESE